VAWLDEVTVDDLDTDPYAVYARMRREQPVGFVPCVGSWFIALHADVARVAEDTAAFTAENGTSPAEVSFGTPTIITVDGDVHHDLRRGFDGRFRPRAVEGYVDELVRPLAERLADALAGEDQTDLMASFFEPISVLSLGGVFGLDHLGADTLRRWFKAMNAGSTNFERDPSKQAVCDAVCAEIDDVLVPHMTRLLTEPDDSTLSHMLHAGRPPGDPREIDFVLPSIKVALIGGLQEPGHGAGSVLAGLLGAHQWGDVVADPDLVPRAIDEGIRWVAPIGTQIRTARHDVELGGATIPAGAAVAGLLGSANRDGTVFADPEVYDLHRDAQALRRSQSAFGFGKHFCSGHAFARQQIRIAFEVLIERFPGLTADPGRPPLFRGWEFRAPTTLWVRLTPDDASRG
jgi:aromatic O-demethylase, cytochrome P450 subunit